MSKRTQVVLNQNVRKLGRYGDVVEVAPGYARNYLIPQGFASNVTPGVLKQVEKRRETEKAKQEELRQSAEQQKAAIEAIGKISISKQAGEKDTIFGTVTTAEIAEAIKAATAQVVDKRDISVNDIKKLGTYTAEIELHPDVSVNLEIEVVAK
jgi:large subunit ribosomal protein L9